MKIILLSNLAYVEAPSHSEIMAKIEEGFSPASITSSNEKSHFKCLISDDGTKIRFYSLHKVRGKKSFCHSKTLRKPHWNANIYTLDREIIEEISYLRLTQRTRHFDMVLKF